MLTIEENRERQKLYMREYRKSPKAKENQKLFHQRWYNEHKRQILDNPNRKVYQKEWHENNRLKNTAHWIVRKSLKVGIIIKPEGCSICGATNVIHAHHFDYLKPLDIRWFCSSCHKKVHLGLLVI